MPTVDIVVIEPHLKGCKTPREYSLACKCLEACYTKAEQAQPANEAERYSIRVRSACPNEVPGIYHCHPGGRLQILDTLYCSAVKKIGDSVPFKLACLIAKGDNLFVVAMVIRLTHPIKSRGKQT